MTRYLVVAMLAALMPHALAGQHEHAMPPSAEAVGDGWRLLWMAQVFPVVTAGAPFGEETHLREREAYLTQPAVMANLVGPERRFVLRTTLNAEQFTQPEGEFTFGGWGEGFIDKRHPHTVLHEFMLSLNLWDAPGGALSLSAGKGFAPFGTEDPMSRPVVKYPTNHHLSQVLERWTAMAAYLHRSGWSAEVGIFGGDEPQDAYDLSNIESFGNSWSARLAHRFGDGGIMAPLELSASWASITETHAGADETTTLLNGAARYAAAVGGDRLYGLLEASWSDPEEEGEEGYWSVLGEAQLARGPHRPYARVELATRPEYHRDGAPGTPGFFRYDHDAHADGATRWLIGTLGYGYTPAGGTVSARPFVEAQYHRVSAERGGVDPEELFGKRGFWSVSTGFRLLIGGDPMRMGGYGVLDPMSSMGGEMAGGMTGHEGH